MTIGFFGLPICKSASHCFVLGRDENSQQYGTEWLTRILQFWNLTVVIAKYIQMEWYLNDKEWVPSGEKFKNMAYRIIEMKNLDLQNFSE